MLCDKIIRIGYILQMVKANRGSYVIVSQYNVHPFHYSGNDVSVGRDPPK